MAALFIEGFDKYGPVSGTGQAISSGSMAGEWSSITNCAIVASLNAGTGYALGVGSATRNLGTNASRLIVGFRFNSSLTANYGFTLSDVASAQCSVTINSSGSISIRTGNTGQTAIATSAILVVANSTHYLEADITIGTAGAYQLWLDGVSILSGTGNTRAGTTNNYANALLLSGIAANLSVDDLYVFDTTGSQNNAALLNSPRVETTFPISDAAVQFSFAAGILGQSRSTTGSSSGLQSANSLLLRPFRPQANCTISAISCVPVVTGATINTRPVIYADSAGAPGTLLSGGSTVVGTTNGTTLNLPLTTPQNLTAGTQYWIGLMVDLGTLNLTTYDGSNLGYRATATFTSGAPGTAPAMTSGQPTFLMWGTLSASSANFPQVNANPPQLTAAAGSLSYNGDSTVGHEDLYNFGNLSVIPASVYVAKVTGWIAKSDTGTRTLTLRTKSSSSDSTGSLSAQAPGTTFSAISSIYELDPNGSIPWTGTSLNAAQSGVRIES